MKHTTYIKQAIPTLIVLSGIWLAVAVFAFFATFNPLVVLLAVVGGTAFVACVWAAIRANTPHRNIFSPTLKLTGWLCTIRRTRMSLDVLFYGKPQITDTIQFRWANTGGTYDGITQDDLRKWISDNDIELGTEIEITIKARPSNALRPPQWPRNQTGTSSSPNVEAINY